METRKGPLKVARLQVAARGKIMDEVLMSMARAQGNGLDHLILTRLPPFTSIEIMNDLLSWGYDVHREVDIETSRASLDIMFAMPEDY